MALLSLKVTSASSVTGNQIGSATVKSAKLSVASTVGLVLSGGGVGPSGPPGVGASWKGIWNSGTTYAIGDGVQGSDGHNYISLTAGNLNHNPTSTTGFWSDLIPPNVATVSSGTAVLPMLIAHTSAELTAALIVCGSAGGGTIQCAAGTYTGNFVLPAKTIIDGVHPSLVTLTQANGANGDVVQGKNFLTLTGKVYAAGDYALGCPEAGLRNVTIDGNKAGNASGYSIRLWGRGLILDHVWVQNGVQGDIWTEFTDVDSFSDPAQKLEGTFIAIKSTNSGGDGWTFRGPHDSIIYGVTSYNHAAWAFTVDAVNGSYNGNVRLWEHNSFLCTSGDLRTLNVGSVLMYGGSMTGAFVGTGFQPSATSGACKLLGVQVAGRLIYFDLKSQGHQIIATVANSPTSANSDIVKLNGCSGCQVILEGFTGDVGLGFNCNIVNAVSDLLNDVSGIINTGLRTTLVAGTLNQQSPVRLQTIGNGGTTGRFQIGSAAAIFTNAGYAPILPSSNKTLMAGGWGASTYSASITPDNSFGALQNITVTNGTAFTINAPAISEGVLTFSIKNSSGGAMGVITWNATYKLAGAFTNPANTKTRTITFQWDGTNWTEIGRAAADI